nr:pentatricopeptide repeat-containing protein At2g01860 [Ipomoea trifida]
MENLLWSIRAHVISPTLIGIFPGVEKSSTNGSGVTSCSSSSTLLVLNRGNRRGERIALKAQFNSTRVYNRRLPKNLRYPRRPKLPPEFDVGFRTVFENDHRSPPEPIPGETSSDKIAADDNSQETLTKNDDDELKEVGEEQEGNEVLVFNDGIEWEPEEIEAISSLFKGRIPQKPGNLDRKRPLPLPLPHKLRPLGLPTPKRFTATNDVSFARKSISKRLYKEPSFLLGLAKEIKGLSPEEPVSTVLSKWAPFLRKGSLSLTIRELGHFGLPSRALQTFCWAQKHPHLFPDDRILASTIEVLARSHELKVSFDLDKFISLSSRSVFEAMLRGCIKGGSLKLALKLLSAAKDVKGMVDAGLYAKLILKFGKNSDKDTIVLQLLEELAERDDLDLTQQDCTAIMKVCTRLRKFELVEGLYDWYKMSGRDPGVVMYTTLIHSRYMANRYREALAVVWEMEAANCLFDLPAYSVVIKLFVALNDISRAARYFSKLKEAGFSPTFDIYRDLMKIYSSSGRLAKCQEISREAEMAGFKWNYEMSIKQIS